jgi:hypothetical protein
VLIQGDIAKELQARLLELYHVPLTSVVLKAPKKKKAKGSDTTGAGTAAGTAAGKGKGKAPTATATATGGIRDDWLPPTETVEKEREW